MSDPTNLPDTCNVISSLGSAAGPTPWTLPDGRVIDPCGLAAALASLSARQVREMGLTISGISGRRGSTSSASASLQSSLESRLKVRLRASGSTSCRLTWKALITPSGGAFFLLRASALPNSATGHGLWQTPTTRDGKGQSGKGNRERRGRNGRLHVANLCDQIVDLGRPDLVRSTSFRCALMGYPPQWEVAMPTGMRSSRRLPPPSSQATAKPETSKH